MFRFLISPKDSTILRIDVDIAWIIELIASPEIALFLELHINPQAFHIGADV